MKRGRENKFNHKMCLIPGLCTLTDAGPVTGQGCSAITLTQRSVPRESDEAMISKRISSNTVTIRKP